MVAPSSAVTIGRSVVAERTASLRGVRGGIGADLTRPEPGDPPTLLARLCADRGPSARHGLGSARAGSADGGEHIVYYSEHEFTSGRRTRRRPDRASAHPRRGAHPVRRPRPGRRHAARRRHGCGRLPRTGRQALRLQGRAARGRGRARHRGVRGDARAGHRRDHSRAADTRRGRHAVLAGRLRGSRLPRQDAPEPRTGGLGPVRQRSTPLPWRRWAPWSTPAPPHPATTRPCAPRSCWPTTWPC